MDDMDLSVLERELEDSVHEVDQQYRREEVDSAIVSTSHPDIVCTALPRHWRSGRSLRVAFKVFTFFPVPDGVRVTLAAGNAHNPFPEMRNNETRMFNQVARFQDLRLVGKSGRGKEFHITLTIHTVPQHVAILKNGIKVTADGIRKKRTQAVPSRQQRSPRSETDEEPFPSRKRRKTSESSNVSSSSDYSSVGELPRPVAVRFGCGSDSTNAASGPHLTSTACSGSQPRPAVSPAQIPFYFMPTVISSTSVESLHMMNSYMHYQLQHLTPYFLTNIL